MKGIAHKVNYELIELGSRRSFFYLLYIFRKKNSFPVHFYLYLEKKENEIYSITLGRACQPRSKILFLPLSIYPSPSVCVQPSTKKFQLVNVQVAADEAN